MELGATVCLPREPRCDVCPVESLCRARREGLEKALPVAKKKKPPREVSLLALVSRRGKRVLLARRRPGGLFGGLWEPPMVECEETSAEASLHAMLGVPVGEMTRVGEQVHLLTHRKLRITIATAGNSQKSRFPERRRVRLPCLEGYGRAFVARNVFAREESSSSL